MLLLQHTVGNVGCECPAVFTLRLQTREFKQTFTPPGYVQAVGITFTGHKKPALLSETILKTGTASTYPCGTVIGQFHLFLISPPLKNNRPLHIHTIIYCLECICVFRSTCKLMDSFIPDLLFRVIKNHGAIAGKLNCNSGCILKVCTAIFKCTFRIANPFRTSSHCVRMLPCVITFLLCEILFGVTGISLTSRTLRPCHKTAA